MYTLNTINLFQDNPKIGYLDILQYLEAIPLLVNDYQVTISSMGYAYAQMETLNLPGGGIVDALIAQVAVTAAERIK